MATREIDRGWVRVPRGERRGREPQPVLLQKSIARVPSPQTQTFWGRTPDGAFGAPHWVRIIQSAEGGGAVERGVDRARMRTGGTWRGAGQTQ